MNKTNEHYVSKVHLRGFANNGIIIRNDLIRDNIPKNKSYGISGVCYRKNLYEVQDSNGNFINHNYTEDALEIIESKYGDIKKKILDNVNKSKIDLSITEQNDLRNMVSTLFFRNLEAFDASRQLIAHIAQQTITATPEEAIILAQSFLLPQKTQDANCSFKFSVILNLVREQLKNLKLIVGLSDNMTFITGDTPIWSIVSGEDEHGMPVLSVVGFPITPHVILYFANTKYPDGQCLKVLDKDVKISNINIARKANQYLLSQTSIDKNDFQIYKQENQKARAALELRYTNDFPSFFSE